jgi:hypothetical protein
VSKKIRVITKLPNSEQSYKGKVKTHKYINRQNQSTTGKLKTVMTMTWYRHFQRNGGLNQILKRQTSSFHYDSKVPAVAITVFITTPKSPKQDSQYRLRLPMTEID